MIQRAQTLFLGTSLISLFLGNTALAAPYTYPQSLIDNYMAQCKASAISIPMSPALAQKLCNCVLETAQNRYSADRFRQLLRESEEGEAPQELLTMGEACMDKLTP